MAIAYYSDLANLMAKRLRVYSNPDRLQALLYLMEREYGMTVSELAMKFPEQHLSTTSKRLGILHEAGLVDYRDEGSFRRYYVPKRVQMAKAINLVLHN